MIDIRNKEFQVHRLNEQGIAKANAIAEIFDVALDNLKCYCPEGRELAIVRTKLEEACFFAKKSIANLPGNQL